MAGSHERFASQPPPALAFKGRLGFKTLLGRSSSCLSSVLAVVDALLEINLIPVETGYVGLATTRFPKHLVIETSLDILFPRHDSPKVNLTPRLCYR